MFDEIENNQEMCELIDRAEAIEGIRKGLNDVANGRTISLSEFEKELNEVTAINLTSKKKGELE